MTAPEQDQGTGIKTMLNMLEHTVEAVQLNTDADWRAAVELIESHAADAVKLTDTLLNEGPTP